MIKIDPNITLNEDDDWVFVLERQSPHGHWNAIFISLSEDECVSKCRYMVPGDGMARIRAVEITGAKSVVVAKKADTEADTRRLDSAFPDWE